VIPRARKLDIRFTVFDEWERIQPRVLSALLKAYVLSRSASCAQEIVEAFGQSRFSRGFLQRLVRRFEERLKRYHRRRLRNWPYVFIDGMSVKVRDGYLKQKVVLFALGMDNEHKCELLDWILVDSEDEASVRALLIDLKARGLVSPELFIVDDSTGIEAALKLEYPRTIRQSCAFHKVKGIQRYLRSLRFRKEILREAGDVYQLSCSRAEALRRLREFSARWKRKEPEAVRLFAKGFEDTLHYFDFPEHMWVSIRTTNPLEQLIGKLREWTSRFRYFHGLANLDLALFTYICHKNGELVPDSSSLSDKQLEEVSDQIPTLIVA
jgi:putative transposase